MLVSEHSHFIQKDTRDYQNVGRLCFETAHMEHAAPQNHQYTT